MLKQIEREVRMREGASKLLAACSQREQALEASKSLLTCNARILALLSQLQRMRKAQILKRMGRRSEGVQGYIVCMGKLIIDDWRGILKESYVVILQKVSPRKVFVDIPVTSH